jgi:hypothetical protein
VSRPGCTDCAERPFTLIGMRYRIPAYNEYGDPADLVVEGCWRCGMLVNIMLMSIDEHVEVAHPVVPQRGVEGYGGPVGPEYGPERPPDDPGGKHSLFDSPS